MEIGERKIILVVDDAPDARFLLVAVMKKMGFPTLQAENGQKAWEILCNAEIGLVLSDYNMPEMDGFELTRLVRKESRFNHVPILIITGDRSQESINRASKIGVDGYVTKPFSPKNLFQKISKAVEYRASFSKEGVMKLSKRKTTV